MSRHGSAIGDQAALKEWIAMALGFVGKLPPNNPADPIRSEPKTAHLVFYK